MFCPKCGTEISDSSSFCSKCGASIQEGSKRVIEDTINAPESIQDTPVVVEASEYQLSSNNLQPFTGENTDSGIKSSFLVTIKRFSPIIAAVLSVIGIIAWVVPYFGILLAIVGIVFGVLGLKIKKVLSIVSISLLSVSLLFSFIITFVAPSLPSITSNYNWLEEDISDLDGLGSELTFSSTGWEEALSPNNDNMIKSLSRSYLLNVYGSNGTINSSQIMSAVDVSDDSRDIIEIALKNGKKLLALNSKILQDPGTTMILSSEIKENRVNTVFDPKDKENTLTTPSSGIKALAKPLYNDIKGLLKNYNFNDFDDISFSTSREKASFDAMMGGNYVLRNDGYSQLLIGAFDKAGNDNKSIFIIFKDGEIVGSGFGPFYSKS